MKSEEYISGNSKSGSEASNDKEINDKEMNEKDIKSWPLKPIARISTALPEKFGLPRQSGLAEALTGTIVFEPEFRNPEALRGLEDFEYIWLLWGFEVPDQEGWTPTVRPPRLGGNKRMGVFATRSPFRPNHIGLSSVKLEGIEFTVNGPEIHVSGVDLRDQTPIFDIKPYLPYTDSHPDAVAGWTGQADERRLEVVLPEPLAAKLPENKRTELISVLENDPRPSYHGDPERVYGMSFAGFEIKFTVNGAVLKVKSIE